MMKLALIPAVALLGLRWRASRPLPRQQETERVDRTAHIRAGGQLRRQELLRPCDHHGGSNRGDVSSTPSAAPRATGSITSSWRSRETSSGVTIEANKKDNNWEERDNNVVDTEIDIQVPADVKLDVEVFSSDVRVTGVRGEQKLHTFSGDIDVADARRLDRRRDLQRRHRAETGAGRGGERRLRQLQRIAAGRRPA